MIQTPGFCTAGVRVEDAHSNANSPGLPPCPDREQMTTATIERPEERDEWMPNSWPLFESLGPIGALLTAPRVARMYIRLVLAEWGMTSLTDIAELIVSELTTNAVRASTGPAGFPVYDDEGRLSVIHLRLMSDRIVFRIEVWDSIPTILGTPVVKATDEYDTSGRGLTIVESGSDQWGFSSVPGWPGKMTYAELRVQLHQQFFGGGNPIRGVHCMTYYLARDLPVLVFRALFPEYELHKVYGKYLVVPKDEMRAVFISDSLGAIAFQIVEHTELEGGSPRIPAALPSRPYS